MSNVKIYSDDFTGEIIFPISSGDITVNEAHRLHNIGGNMTVYCYLKRYSIEPPKEVGFKMKRKK